MTDDIRDVLDALGDRFDFGEYETAAYLAVLEHGEVTAAELADLTDIPQPRVYDTVRGLADRGLVELQETRPMRVLAVDPREAFGGVQTSLDDLVDGLADRFTEPARRSEAVSLIRSRSTIIRHLEGVIENADYELLLSLSPSLLDQLVDDIAARTDTGVHADLLLSPAAVTDLPTRRFEDLEVRVRTRPGVSTPIVAVADGFYSIYATRQALTDGTDRYGVLFNRSELGFLVSGFFNTVLWPSAAPVSRDDSEPRFPRRYASLRRCVSDVRDHSEDLYGTVVGRYVESGERCVVSGRITTASPTNGRETATLRMETDDGPVSIGGPVEVVGEIEAHRIRVDRGEPPDL